MNSNECYLDMHENCLSGQFCECLCHVHEEELFDELDELLEGNINGIQ